MSADKVLESGQIRMDDELKVKELKFNKDYNEAVAFSLAMVKNGEFYSKTISLSGPTVYRPNLSIKWNTFRNKLEPGEKETWQMNICYADGKPAKAQLMATMFDASLNFFEPYYFRDPKAFEPFEIYSNWEEGSANYRSSSYGYLNHRYPYLGEESLKLSSLRGNVLRGYAKEDDIYFFQSLSATINSDGEKGYISGVVLDAMGNPIVGASVECINGKGAAVTNKKGEFKIRYEGTTDIRIEYIGMITVSEKTKSGSYLKIVMLEENQALSETVVVGYGTQRKSSLTGSISYVRSDVYGASSPNQEAIEEAISKAAAFGDKKSASTEQLTMPNVTARKNFDELAFWKPRLVTDSKGNINLEFTLPESITSWNFYGWAHDKHMSEGYAYATVKAVKAFVVQPNMPRFLRKGDKGEISTRIFNNSEKLQTGVVALQLLDPETEEVLYEEKKKLNVEAKSTGEASFSVDFSKGSKLYNKVEDLVICKIVAASKEGSSDGEQHYLSILTDKEKVTKTLAIKLQQGETATIPVEKMYGKDAEHRNLTVEFVQHPMWYALKSLATLSENASDDAYSQLTSYYASSIADYLADDIKSDSLRKEVLGKVADKDYRRKLRDESIEKLYSLQNSDGTWSWFKGMQGSEYMTVSIAEQMIHLKNLIGKKYCRGNLMLERAMPVVDSIICRNARSLRNLKKWELSNVNEYVLHAMYIRMMSSSVRNEKVEADIEYLMKEVLENPSALTIYGKAIFANVLALKGDKQHAGEFLESIRQYSVKTPSMGVYFDTSKAYYSWYDYKLPTVSAAVEAFHNIEPADTEMIEGMQKWLLEEKRTHEWNTQINSNDAIYALLLGNLQNMEKITGSVEMALDGKKLQLEAPKGAEGFSKAKIKNVEAKKLTIHSIANNANADSILNKTSWGSIFAECEMPIANIDTTNSCGFSIERKVEPVDGSKELKVGDKVREVITFHADRDFDFVKVTSNRAACLEPVEQTTGYDWHTRAYVKLRDNRTEYSFYRLPKGDYMIETEYYIDRVGDYESGSCNISCQYAPAFSAYSKPAEKIEVKK